MGSKMGALFLITGIILIPYAFAFQEGEFKNSFFFYLLLGSGGALLISLYKGNTEIGAYLFFIAGPILISVYEYFKHKDNL